MLEIKTNNGEVISEFSAAKLLTDSRTDEAVIVLHDRTTAAEKEASLLQIQVNELSAENGSLRHENQRLKAELREVRLVLSKVQIDELRRFERVGSWLRSFKKMI